MPEGFRHVAWGNLDELRAAIDPAVSAVLIEPIQGEARVLAASDAFLRDLRNAVPPVAGATLYGPLPAPMTRRAGRFRGRS